MKKSGIITAFLAVFMMVVPSKMSAQEENGFQKINVIEDFTDNGFQWFRDAQLLCAGNKEKSNVSISRATYPRICMVISPLVFIPCI